MVLVRYSKIPGEDETARALHDAGRALDVDAATGGLEARALRRKTGFRGVEDGLWVGDLSTDVFEPVRRRRRRSQWEVVQSVEEATAQLRQFLVERPDLCR
jgi:hypothetical protein